MRVLRSLRAWWRPAVVPLMVWFLLVVVGSGILLWQQDNSRQAVAHRFDNGVRVLGDYMTGLVAEQMQRQLVQAKASLTDPVVESRDFDRVAAGLGYASAVLLDSRGRVLRNYPASPSVVGQDLATRYEHVRVALQGRPAVSQVVPNAARGIPVAAFAVPFETTSGRRVFSGALPIRASPLATYFTTSLSLTGARVQLTDTSGSIVAATDSFDLDRPTLAAQDGPLAAVLGRDPAGRYRADGKWWRYSSAAIAGAPWQLSATVPESVLFASLTNTEIAARSALGGAAMVGLAVVLAAGRARALGRERDRHQAELARHAEQLQEANTHLADVMAMLSHDVRQPLAKIVGLGSLLQEEWGAVPEHTKLNYVERMTAAGHRANDLVTDILMLAQFDAGAMLARPVRMDISHAAREAVAAHYISAGTPISVIAPDETTGLADPAQLQLILGNLLTNATKYGSPPIEVTVVNAGEQVAIRVADQGEGVPPEFVPHLFDRFARAGSGVATTTAGTGLGLYLVRQLAQAGGLDVTYEPNQPRGAVFTLTAPRATGGPRLLDPDPDPDPDMVPQLGTGRS